MDNNNSRINSTYHSDFEMYCMYFLKTIKLWFLKNFLHLDFTGRYHEKNQDFNGYEGCYPVKNFLKRLNISEKDSILDIGCGKGLFLYYAKDFKFSKIDGIEYSKEIVDIANENLKNIDDERIHVYNCDARDFQSYDDYGFFFINNPFSKEIMSNVVDKLVKSQKEKTRKITVLYQFPFNKDLFINKGFKLEHDGFPNSILVLEDSKCSFLK